MFAVYSLLAGAIAKVYDDIVDMNLEVPEYVKEILKGLQLITLTLLSVNDFNFSVLLYAVCFINSLEKPECWSNPYEFSLLWVYPVFFLCNFATAKLPSIIDIPFIIPFAIHIFGSMVVKKFNLLELSSSFDAIADRKEVSILKYVSRSSLAFSCFVVFFLANKMDVSEYMLKIILFATAYLFVSSLFQFYMLYDRIHTAEELKDELIELSKDIISVIRIIGVDRCQKSVEFPL
jgi:hypothetical protein